MTSFKERIIETIIQDLENIKTLEAGKNQRNECNLLLKRIESAKKLFLEDQEQNSKLLEIEKKVKALKGA